MTIRRKLYLSYVAMLLVPLVAMLMISLAFLYAGGRTDIRTYLAGEKDLQYRQAFVIGELNYALQHNAELLEDPDYWAKLNRTLGRVSTGLVLFREGRLSQVTPYLDELSPGHDWSSLVTGTPEFVTLNLYRFKTHLLSFTYADGSAGEALVLRRFDVIPLYWHPIFGIAVCLFVALTTMLMTYLMSRSIIRPIDSLKKSALRMKEGDLTQEVRTSVKGEIGELSTALEDMRVRLKGSIDQTLQYEVDRKMLLSSISHDLKTPISAIKGYVEGLRDGIANTDEKRERYMETIYRKATEMDKLIDELFLYSKLDLHTIPFDMEQIDLCRYLEHVAEEHRFDLEKSGVELRFVCETGKPLIVAADPEKLSRVFSNIFDNSVKYMSLQDDSAGHTIRLRLLDQGAAAIIVIEDNGPGIDLEALPHIFDRFYRAEQSRNSDTGGSGLGLAIVRQIVEGHHGTVRAENVLGGGARFSITLPKAESGKDGEPS